VVLQTGPPVPQSGTAGHDMATCGTAGTVVLDRLSERGVHVVLRACSERAKQPVAHVASSGRGHHSVLLRAVKFRPPAFRSRSSSGREAEPQRRHCPFEPGPSIKTVMVGFANTTFGPRCRRPAWAKITVTAPNGNSTQVDFVDQQVAPLTYLPICTAGTPSCVGIPRPAVPLSSVVFSY
jgi:hypothetical protein